MQKPVHRERGESSDVADLRDLRDVVAPPSLGLEPCWGVNRASDARCERCRRRLRAGEPMLQGHEDGVFCGLCGRHHWLRHLEL